MKTYFKPASLILMLMISANQASAQSEPQLITIPLSRPGETVNLEIGILSARIEVIGEDREDASFEISVMEGTRKIVTPSGTKSLKTGAYSIDVEEEDNNISLDTDWRANKVSVIARVPRLTNMELSTVNNGEIFVSNVTGKLLLENTNGPITATNISGSVVAESVNDDINVSFASLDSEQVMSFSSINGTLNIGLPAGAGAELHIDSDQGEITSEFEVEVQASKPIVSRENSRRGTEISVESVIIATIQGGGTIIKLKTLNGDINISKSGN